MMSASDTHDVQLPSGLVVKMTPLRMADENRLAQAAKANDNFDNVIEAVLAARIGAVVAPGPYPHLVEGGSIAWDDLLSGDTFAAMIELRKISYDDGKTFTVLDLQCPSGQCPKFDYDIDLDTDIIRRDLDAVGAEHVRNGVPLSCQIDGHNVGFVLATGATVKRVRKLDAQYPKRMMATRMRSRIVGVEGIEPLNIMNWLDGDNGASKAYPGLRAADAERLRDAMDEHECGIDTEVEITCEHCQRRYMINLPFDAGFLAPGIGIAQRKRRRRLGSTSLDS
jgi:hypothetical protein